MKVCFEVFDDKGIFDRYWEIENLSSFTAVEREGKIIYNFQPKSGASFSVSNDRLLIYYIFEDNI